MSGAKFGIIGGSVLFWGFVATLAVVDTVTLYDAPWWAYAIPLAAGATISTAHLVSTLVCRHIEAMAREASTAKAYKLALLTVGGTLRPLRPDDSAELPRVAGDDYHHDAAPTVPIRRRPQLIHDSTRHR